TSSYGDWSSDVCSSDLDNFEIRIRLREHGLDSLGYILSTLECRNNYANQWFRTTAGAGTDSVLGYRILGSHDVRHPTHKHSTANAAAYPGNEFSDRTCQRSASNGSGRVVNETCSSSSAAETSKVSRGQESPSPR